MAGFKECSLATTLTIGEVLVEPSACFRGAVSPNTQLALQIMAKASGIETPKIGVSTYRQLSNLIYYANNYFDIGVLARQKLFLNDPSRFVFLCDINQKTYATMIAAAKELEICQPQTTVLIKNFLTDGVQLSEQKNRFSGVEYREIDSGIFGTLVFGVIGESDCLNEINYDFSEPDLKKKYNFFCLLSNDTNKDNYTGIARKFRGFQALEMILACLDDQQGQAEDKILGLRNSQETNNGSVNELINKYKMIAVECGISPLVVEVACRLVNTHKYRVKRIKTTRAIEPDEIQHCRNFGNIYLLREWLNANSLLSEIAR